MKRNILLGVVAAMAGLVPAKADLIWTQVVADYGNYSQVNSGVTYMNTLNVGPQACVPTAVTNSLIYLNNTCNISGLLQSGYTTVNTLASLMDTTNNGGSDPENGTSNASMVSGLTIYLSNQGVSSSVSIIADTASFDPVTTMQLYNWASAGDAVDFSILWTGGGGHELSLYGIVINTDVNGDATGSGSLMFMDPWGGTEGSSSATATDITNATFTTGTDGVVSISYSGGAAGNPQDPDNPGDNTVGTLGFGMAIVAVPEPSTWALLGAGAIVSGVIVYRRRRVA